MKTKKLLSVLGVAALAVNMGVATLAFAQTTQTGTQEISCGATPVLSGTDDLTFDADAGTGGIQPATVQSTTQTTTASDAGITIVDNRGPASAGCTGGDVDVTLTVAVTDNFCDETNGTPDTDCTDSGDKALVNGNGDTTVDAGEAAAALTFNQGAIATCAATCSYLTDTTTTGSKTLSTNASYTPSAAVNIFTNASGFSGTANLSTLDYSLLLPAFPPAGTFESTLTYTLAYS